MTDTEVPTKPKRTRKKAAAPAVEATVSSTNGSARTMSDAHKEALARGREQGRIVRNYVDALSSHKPKRGRKRTRESIEARLAKIEESYEQTDPLTRLHLAQEKLDLMAELETTDSAFDISELEDAFVEVAAAYSEAKGLTRGAWREIGVQPSVLTRAGITR